MSFIFDLFSSLYVKGLFLCSGSFMLSFIFALYVLPRILFISRKKHLYDTSGGRKSHDGEVPRLGGLIFVPAILCTLSLLVALRYLIGFPMNPAWVERTFLELLFLVSGVSFLYLVGAKDDLVGVSYRKKFLAQFFVASLIPFSGLYLNQLYGLCGFYQLPPYIGMPLTILLIVYITNAINLIDGIDGLAAGICSLSFLVLGVFFLFRGLYVYSMLSFTILGCLLPFTYYNVFGQGKKMFMGDAGSLTLGYLLSFLVLKYAMNIPDYGISYDVRSLVLPLSLLFIPCFDAFRVMVIRAIHGKSMFIADRNHIHHKCLSAGMSHLQATSFLLSCNVSLILVNLWLSGFVRIHVILLLDIAVTFVVINWLERHG